MTEQQKRKRFLITTSIKGVERAKNIMMRREFFSVSAFAKANLLGKISLDKFLSRQPIQTDTFIKICEGLNVKDWREFTELEPVLVQCEKETQSRTLQGCLVQDSREVGKSFRRVTIHNLQFWAIDRPSRLLKRIEFSQVRAIEFPIVDGTTDRISQ